MSSIDIIIAIVILAVIAIIIYYGFNKSSNGMTNVENLINTDNTRKKNLTKCCTEPKCYSKPPFMRENCDEHKQEAQLQLDTMFEPAYTQEEYYKKLNELNIIKTQDMPNVEKNQKYIDKLNERITLDTAVGNILFDKIVADKQDEVCGYNIKGYSTSDFAPFIPAT